MRSSRSCDPPEHGFGFRSRPQRGFALPFVLGFLLVIAMIMGAVVLSFQNAARLVGETERIKYEVTRVESLMERARAAHRRSVA